MEFNKIVMIIIALVVLIAAIVFFTSQQSFLTQGFGSISGQSAQGSEETAGRVGDIGTTASGVENECADGKDNDGDFLIDCDDPDCINRPCKSGEDVGRCLTDGSCGGWRGGPCTKNSECIYSGYECVDGTCTLS
ncbi:MAG: hypothetical protein GOU97_00870 [Nanoarchaeota archaeon]|nr:hypothetical protein [Nanoarchaeota archaeon]